MSWILQNVTVQQFQVSQTKRIISRVCFYTTVFVGMWAIGNLMPGSAETEAKINRRLGVAEAYWGIPIDQIPAVSNSDRKR